jgi:8-oxo-dGTP pyrophosphatase MutT (NUDIX family)
MAKWAGSFRSFAVFRPGAGARRRQFQAGMTVGTIVLFASSLSMTPSDSTRETIWCPHVTVACVVHDRDRFLIVEEDVRGDVRFNQPAGHLEPGESLLEAARRETLEETGWEVELESFIGVRQYESPEHAAHIVRFAFAAKPLRHDPERALDAGILRTHWLSHPEIAGLGARLRSPLVLHTLEDWLAGQRLPLRAVGDTACA